MKLSSSILFLAALQASTLVVADDTLRIVNINQPTGWVAQAAWDRGNSGDIRPILASDSCTDIPYTPWSDIERFCINWGDARGHIWTTAGNRHCFKRRSESSIIPGRSTLSIWTTAPCEWDTPRY